MKNALIAVALLVHLSSALTAGPTLGTASPYNVFVFNSFSETGADTGGRLAVGTNATFTGTYAVAQGIIDAYVAPGNDSLVVNGQITAGIANVIQGNAY